MPFEVPKVGSLKTCLCNIVTYLFTPYYDLGEAVPQGT